MELSASSGLWAFAFFCHIGILVSSESFTLKGSDSPVIATVGTDVILPCQLSPRTNAKQMEVRWHSSEIAGLTHHYVNGHDALQKQNPHYRGRTELFKEELPNGNVSLLLKKVQVADGGSYVCFIGNKLNYLESLVELKVGGDLFPYDKHPYVVTTVILCLSLVIFGVVTGFIFKTERESKGKLQIAKGA